MCDHGTEAMVRVKIPADLSCDGQERWKNVGIDACIATLVGALQAGGVDMRGSCCGHGQRSGHIHLQDGRGLLILSPDENADYLLRTTAKSEPASQACGCPWDGHMPACLARVMRYPCGCSAVGANVPAYCPDHGEADTSPAKDPIAAAVNAQIDPLKDELTAIGHKLAKETR